RAGVTWAAGKVGPGPAWKAARPPLVEPAGPHEVDGALGAAGVARVRDGGRQDAHVAGGGDAASDGRHRPRGIEPVRGRGAGLAGSVRGQGSVAVEIEVGEA